MANLFTTILNMSLTASIIIGIVLLARLCLKKVPKIFSYVLWSVVLFRLICPVSISLPVSVLAPISDASTSTGTSYTASMEYISMPERAGNSNTQAQQDVPVENIEYNSTNESAAIVAPEADTSPVIVEQQKMSASELALTVLGWLWVAGMVGMLGMTTWQTVSLKRRLADACIVRGNIFESDKIDTAFILGVFNPKIYLPLGLPFDIQKAVVAHEQTHQRRGDHIVKLVSYIALAIHWFNPLVWLSFKLMCDDMEKSCDEAVLRELYDRGYTEKSVKRAYGHMLLALGGGRQHIFSPVSFAENSTKARVRNVVAYSRIARNVSIGLAVACALVALLCVVNPAGATERTVSGTYISDNEVERDPNAVQLTVGNVTFWSDVTELDLSGQQFDDISALAQCTRLESLNLSQTQITDISVLANIPTLKYLDLSANGYVTDDREPHSTFSDWSPLSSCTNLVSLNLNSTGIRDLSILQPLTNLQELDLSHNLKSVISTGPGQQSTFKTVENEFALGSLVNLRRLDISETEIADISFIEQLDSLEILNISRTAITDITSVASLNNIVEFYADSTRINDWSALENKDKLKKLSAQIYGGRPQADEFPHGLASLEECIIGVSFADYSGLADCKKLKRLTMNGIEDVAPLSNLTELEYLMFGDGSRIDLSPLSVLSSLKELHLNSYPSNEDGYMFLSGMKELQKLVVHDERLFDLSGFEYLENLETLYIMACGDLSPLGGCKKLKDLEISYIGDKADLSAFSGISNLERLVFTGNGQLIDISGLYTHTKIKYLDLRWCGVSDISALSSMQELEELNLAGNQITDISPLSSLNSLMSLNLSSNNISDITPLSSLDSLVYLNLSTNNVSDVSPLFGLEGFRTGSRVVLDNPDDNRPYIDLLGNPLTDEQLIELYEALDGNTTIYSEDISIYG